MNYAFLLVIRHNRHIFNSISDLKVSVFHTALLIYKSLNELNPQIVKITHNLLFPHLSPGGGKSILALSKTNIQSFPRPFVGGLNFLMSFP